MNSLRVIDRSFIKILNWFLSSHLGLYMAFIWPLVALKAGSTIQTITQFVSSGWIQLWALFVLAIIGAEGVHHIRKHREETAALHADVKKLHKHLGV